MPRRAPRGRPPAGSIRRHGPSRSNTHRASQHAARHAIEPLQRRLRLPPELTASMSGFHLAQLNIARLREPIDSPLLADFVAALEPINQLADCSPGFVWRLQTDDGDATSIRAFDDDMLLVNMSVWESIEALSAFVYRSDHRDVMVRRQKWFERMSDPFLVLWWVPAGHLPTLDEAKERLELLRRNGPSPDAFTFRTQHVPPGVASDTQARRSS